MRDGSVIAIGKGNPDWNFSGPHGAGRIMSRAEAKKNLSLLDYQNIMKVCPQMILNLYLLRIYY